VKHAVVTTERAPSSDTSDSSGAETVVVNAVNEKCATCGEWLEGRCGGIDVDPGGCWVEVRHDGERWDDETGELVAVGCSTEEAEGAEEI